jgi:hypothetical protein
MLPRVDPDGSEDRSSRCHVPPSDRSGHERVGLLDGLADPDNFAAARPVAAVVVSADSAIVWVEPLEAVARAAECAHRQRPSPVQHAAVGLRHARKPIRRESWRAHVC